ncbi:GFA family protein [Parashewanella tropica]|uniref:GFA family protein n=1 Tax=Parashewanella tropica TaxID=2547970 RepID=UPI0010592542|nr:GFA family protein [Parashewanella tropica]
MYKGSCLCGKVKFEITSPIKDIIHCHCSLCRKSSGTAYATNGFVESEDFKVLEGSDSLTYFEMKPGKKRHFCSTCASPIYSSNDSDLSRIRVRLGTIDSNVNERPISHNFVTSKASWEDLDAQLPRYEAHEPGRGK